MSTHQQVTVLIDAEEFAGKLGISVRTLWRLLSGRKIPDPVRIGRNTRWRLQEIERWIDDGCKPPVQ
jgi:predicted DNA-binding transcriptional regulator AlpA